MPKYNVKGKSYTIPQMMQEKFESDMPDASVQMYDKDGKSYTIPIAMQNAFKRDHEGWSYDAPQVSPSNNSSPKPMDERGYVFNESELMGESTEYKDSTPPARTLKGIVDAQKPKTMADVDWSKVNANIDFSTEKNPYPQYTGEDVAKNFEKQRIAQQNQEEDSKVDKQYTPKEENTAMDVYDNYMNRFALTKEGSALQKELADIEGKVTNKYIEEFKTSDAYKNIMALYDGSEDSNERVSTLLNETFVKEYGERINNDIAPYRKAYIDEMQTRYGDRFNESIKAVVRKEIEGTVSNLMDEIDTISQNLNEDYGVDDKKFFRWSEDERKRFAMRDNDRQTLRQAKELLEDSRNVIEEATKHKDSGFISGVGRGVRDNLSPEDFTFGISDLADEKRLNNILGRYEKGEKVSDAEMKLLEASAANMVTHAYYDMMLSSGYKAGQVTAESLPFMLEFVANPIAGSGKALAKGLLKVALKKFGSKAINAGTKFGARLLGDALAAGGMTLTSGLAGVEAEATRRMNEGYDYGMRDGKLYVERKPDAISWGEARGKAFAQRAIENQSEMVFNAFSGVGKVLGGKGSILSKLSESKGGKFIKDAFNNKYIKEIAESTQFHGLPVEYMEEVYNNGANVLLGEMSVEDFADVDKNVETFLGLAPTSVVFGLLGLGGMAIDKVSNRRELKRIYNSLPDDLREQYNRVMQSKGYNAESTKEFVKSVITNPRATEEEKAAAIRLGYCTVADMTYEDAEQAEQSGDVPVTPSVKQEGDNAYENAQVTTTEEVQQVGANARQAVVELSAIEGGEGVRKSIDNFLSNETISEEEVNDFFNSLPAEQQKSAKAYYTTQRALQGAHDAVVKSANNDVDAYEASVAPFVTENENGTRQVTMAQYQGGEWFVTSNDGEHSVLKNTRGEERMVLSKDLEGVNTLNIDEVIERKRTETVQAAESGFEFTTSHHQKTQIPSVGMPLMNGNETFVVVGVDGDVVNVAPAKVNKEGQLEPKGVSPSQMSVSEVLKMQDDFYQASEVAQQIGGSVSEEELKDDVNGLSQENQSGGGNAVMPAPKMNVEQIQPIPTVKRGNKTVTMYHQVPVSRTMADLHDGTMDTQEVNDFIEANISEAQRDLEKAREKKPTMTTDKASYVQSKQAWQAEIDDAQKKLDYWNSVKEEEQRITSNVVLGQNQQAKIVPTTPEEYVANAFGDGGLKITPESYRKETGYGVEEQRKMVGVIASAEKGGISIERASEIIYESGALEEIGFLGDQTDVRDLIIKVLSDGNPRGYMKRRAEERALSESEMYDLGNWTMENFGMTAEEYLAYEENFLPGMIEKYGGFEEESFYANLAEYYEYKDNYESRREDESVAGGSEVLQGEQSVPPTGGGSVDVGGQTSSVPVGVQSGVADATPQIEEVESSTGLSEEEAEVIAEENRRKPLRERVAEWANKLGIDMVVLENLDEVTNSQAREAIESGDGRYPGWYGEKSGKVYIYLPHVTDVKDIDETVIHEVVAHKGLRRLMGEKFDALCDMVWDSMSKENREKFMSYPGVNGNHRAAADEYMAYIAEKTELTEEERGIWDKIVQFVKDLITLNLGVKLSDAQIAGLIRASYAEMKREAGKQKEAEATDTTTHDTKNTSRERHDELLMIATEARKAMGERQAAYFPQLPKQRDLVAAYEKNDSTEITTWKKQFEDVLSKMVPLDIPMVESTIDSVLYIRDAQKHNKDSALYKAYNDIAKMLRKQKSKLESQLTDSDRDVLNAIAYSRGKGTRFRFAKSPQDFDTTQKEAVEKKGIVMSGLNEAVVNVVDVPRHNFTGTGKDAIEKAEKWANDNIAKEHTYHKGREDEFKYVIDEKAIGKFLSKSSTGNSENLGVHLAVLKKLPEVIDNSIDVEIHPDYIKNDKVRSAENGVGRKDLLVHRMYGAVSIDDKIYLTKTTIHEFRDKENKAYDYKITEVKLIISGSSTSNALNSSASVEAAKLLKDVEKSYDNGKKVLTESETRFRSVYHGSGAEFDMFDHSHMGEGEGNQAFGWGTYVTDVEGIGRQYGRATSKPRLSFKGSIVDSEDFYNPWRIIMDLYNAHYGRLRDMRHAAERYSGLVEDDNVKLKELWENVIHTLGNVRSGDLKIVPGRYLYTVEIPDDNGSNYLHWDEDVPKKLENTVKERLFNILAEGQGQAYKEDLKQELDDVFKFYDYTIPSLYNNISAYVGGAKAASQFFADMGYVGISYPAEAMSGGRADGARNFVIFNEADAKIEDRVMFRKVGDNMEHTVMFRSSPLFKGLRELEDGETCDVERIFTENKYFEFSGVNKIKSYSDVAYIFKQLEDESIENAFAVLVKRGKPTVIHLGMGHYTQTMVNKSVLNVAVTRMNPDKIYFVHNHPSGQLKASAQDVRMLQSLQEAYGSKMADGIIINTRSGQYGVFNEDSYTTKVDAQTGLSDTSEAKPLKVYTFSKQVFSKDYQPGRSLLSSEDVARFVSSHRLGDRKKLGLIISNNNGITGNIFLPYTDINKDNAQSIASDIIYYTSVMGGTHAVMFGNTPVRDMAHEGIGMLVEEFSGLRLLDYLKIDGGRYYSASDEGLRFRVANRNQVGFVSNAMKAVEGIKQEKATPQQWLAMIEKQGGLKAGEDKWLGLSDWLKSSDKKTLTKDEVLEFIGENMIRIEEVKYVEQPEVLYFDDYEVYNEWQELGGDKKAFNELAEKYGDDFTIAFSYDETFGIVNVDDAEAAMLFGGYDKGTIGNPINSTRLDYTTEGLDNKREIALTVPTIESWNEYDDIHFGDAGDGRAVAWIRFGEATTYENVDDVQQVTDFHEPYKDVNGLDIYKPIGSFRNGDFIAHGKGRNGDMIYVVYINGNQVPVSYKTLEDARVGMNDYYKEHPRKLRKPLKVLVIDEIQSKRHQEGREKGYKNDSESLKIETAEEDLRKATKAFNDYRDELRVKYDYDHLEGSIIARTRAFMDGMTEAERTEFKRLAELKADATRVLEATRSGHISMDDVEFTEHDGLIEGRYGDFVSRYTSDTPRSAVLADLNNQIREHRISESRKLVPSAPFEKNWHELAMKRMLRLAAEEGFDKVAWTTGAQQAERYNIGTMVRDIEVLPITDAETGEVLDAEFDVYTHSNSGNYISEATGRMNTEQIMEVFGKDLGGKIIEGGRTQSHTVISGKGLNIGGEGMKGFYDRMLPSFVNKYTKKWGTKVGEVELPELEESAQKMWSVDVTEQMKAEVEEQVMFSRKPVGGNSGYTTRTDGTAISLRAEEAESDGTFTAGTFCKIYGVSRSSFNLLRELGIIKNTEWHHTGQSFKKNDFFSWGDSERAVIHGGVDYSGGEVVDGSFADIYMQNKKEIDSLAKDYENKDWEYRREERLHPIPKIADYLYDDFNETWEGLLTEGENRARLAEHEVISNGGFELGTSWERKNMHEKVDDHYKNVARERYDEDAVRRQYEAEYSASIVENKEKEGRNATLKEDNLSTDGKESFLLDILGFFESNADKAYDKVAGISSYAIGKIELNKKEELRKSIRAKYDEMIDGVRAKRQKWVDKKLKEGSIEKKERISSRPEFFVTEREEMNGKFGWFDATSRYNLPIYYTGIDMKTARNMKHYNEYDQEILELEKRYNEEVDEQLMFRKVSEQIEDMFDSAISGDLKGKPISIGKLTVEGKEYLELISGLTLKNDVDFVLNPSDLVHIYNEHYGDNEKDKGNNIPLTKHDIKRMVDVIAFPTEVIYGEGKNGRKSFYFLMDTPDGAYNLLEVYADKKGNLSSKTYYKTKKGVSQRVMNISSSLHSTSVADGATLSDVKVPQMFESANISEEKVLFRADEEHVNPLENETVRAWDELASSRAFLYRETAVDYLTAVREFQDLVAKRNHIKVADYENAYDALLALSSRNRTEMDAFDSMVFRPLQAAIRRLVGKKKWMQKWDWSKGELRALDVYAKTKHGIERNRDMAVRSAIATSGVSKSAQSNAISEWERRSREIMDQPLTWNEKRMMLDALALTFGADLKADYSGLSKIKELQGENENDWVQNAVTFVNEYETNHDKGAVENLWFAIRQMTTFSLEKQRKSGLLSGEYMNRQLARYEYYVPLRGWAEDIAEDVYGYADDNVKSKGSTPVKTAHGRTSEAGNPFGAMVEVAYKSISAGNKNLAKQKLYHLVDNNDTGDLVRVNKSWMIRYEDLKDYDWLTFQELGEDEEMPEWVEVRPISFDTLYGATADERAEIEAKRSQRLAEFEELMTQLQSEGKARPITHKSKLKYRPLNKQQRQHETDVYIGGNKYTLTIVGNPRLMQAVNGLLNPNTSENWVAQKVQVMKQFMAGNFTSRNPAFSLTNLFKDAAYGNNQAFIKEGWEYWARFTKNQELILGGMGRMMKYMSLYHGGSWQPKNKAEELFKEFMDNGGATGYTFIETQQEYAAEISDSLGKLTDNGAEKLTAQRGVKLIFDGIEYIGQAAELATRYAAYRTSREMGRSVSKSIIDAKEITVNFNRKGAGTKTTEFLPDGPSDLALLSSVSQFGRDYILFWNAGVQSKYRTFENFKEHPIRTSASMVTPLIFMGGVGLPLLNNVVLPALYDMLGWGSDDDEDYWDLPEHIRQNRLCLRLPKGMGWFTIPMNPEFVTFLRFGDILGAHATGVRPFEATDVLKLGMDLSFPIGINDESTVTAINSVLPSVVQPVFQHMTNTNFYGGKLYKEGFGKYAAYDPEYKKAYSSTSPTMIEISRMMNRLAGGNDIVRGKGPLANINPGIMYNYLSGTLGGYATTFLSVTDAMLSYANGDSFEVASNKLPLVGRFFASGDKDMKAKRLRGQYINTVETFMNKVRHDELGYDKAFSEGKIDVDEWRKFYESEDYKKYVNMKEYVETVKTFSKSVEENPDNESGEALLYESQLEALKFFREWDKKD